MVYRMTEEISDISVVRLDMYYPELSLPDKYEKVMIIQKGESGNGTNLYRNADMKVDVPADFYSWEKLLFHSIADFLKGQDVPEYFDRREWQKNYDEMLKIRRPETDNQVYGRRKDNKHEQK